MWRIHFMVGAMAHTMCTRPISGTGRGRGPNMEPRLPRLVTVSWQRAFRAGSNREQGEVDAIGLTILLCTVSLLAAAAPLN